MADARRTPPEISPEEIAWLLLAVLAEIGIESAAARTRDYGLMTSSGGYRLHDALAFVFRGQAEAGDIIVRDGGATATINGAHQVFGHPAEDGPARFATGPTLAAIVAEWHGASPGTADAAAAILRI
jgi:hypothetical protein